MKQRTVLVVCVVLGITLLAGILLQGPATFSGIRWVPDWTQPTVSPHPEPAPTAESGTRSSHPGLPFVIDGTPLLWIAIAALIVLAGLLLGRMLRRRQASGRPLDSARLLDAGPASEPEPPSAPDAPALQRGFDRALTTLSEDRLPRDAIERAWLGLQEAAEESGVQRRAAETPAEFTQRVLARVHADDDAARTLLDLYLRVRFGDTPVTELDVSVARRSLERLAASWEGVPGATRPLGEGSAS
ncbi:DUF4129 domain-containing protein [Diaminobutyricibacter tongyongensis]|uniref:DUF4129 domain-containing protein n=1 Tax=Leifsonia tongyongensis TaxID=1268043 RepID=A0A6L9XXS7_9MICO|nr:DUF4129 domain-containing protein [Diaminobutyricibacter tongyongensis]NEN06232.1 DUF4129 domain-containing protein [Diaminobutyricibacter tongyongensis]